MSANHGHPWGLPVNKIMTKVHFWFGERDYSDPPAMGKYLSNTIPNNELIFVPDAGHLWILEHLNEVLNVIKKTVVDTK
jgi:pimeloyl-ACP methyl ester carboxylesterase